MKTYVKSNLYHNEVVVKEAEIAGGHLVVKWIFGILFCWLLLIPLIGAIVATVRHNNLELAITSRRVIGKTGVIHTKTLEATLNRVQNVSVTQGFWGKVFNNGTIRIDTAAGKYEFDHVKMPYEVKNILFEQMERVEYDHMRMQAYEIANAIAHVMKKSAPAPAAPAAPVEEAPAEAPVETPADALATAE